MSSRIANNGSENHPIHLDLLQSDGDESVYQEVNPQWYKVKPADFLRAVSKSLNERDDIKALAGNAHSVLPEYSSTYTYFRRQNHRLGRYAGRVSSLPLQSCQEQAIRRDLPWSSFRPRLQNQDRFRYSHRRPPD